MLFFLRKIRSKLLSSNQLGTYLLYAIGEIILVVVGILIAVQIDDWNKGRQKSQQEIESLQQIRSGMHTAMDQLDFCLEEFQLEARRLGIAISYLEEEQLITDSLGYYLFPMLNFPTPKFDRSAYDNLKVRGTELISNDSLRQQILDTYEIEFHSMTLELDQGNRDYRNIILPYVLTYLNVDTRILVDGRPRYSLSNKDQLREDHTFLNMLQFSHSYKNASQRQLKAQKENVRQLITQIDLELSHLKSK